MTTTGNGPSPRRREEEHRHRLAVEALEAVQLRLDERHRLDVARARRQPPRAPRAHVVEVDVVRLHRRREPEREQRAVVREHRRLDDAARPAAAPRSASAASCRRGGAAASSRPRSPARSRWRPDGSPAHVRSHVPAATGLPSQTIAIVSRPSFVAHASRSPSHTGVRYSAGSSCGVRCSNAPVSTSQR